MTLFACYDLSRSPPTYDVVAFLCQVETERLKRGEGAVEIAFTPGPVDGFRDDALWPFSIEERRTLLERIARPMCWLLPACRKVQWFERRVCSTAFGFNRVLHGLRFQTAASARGIRPLRPYHPAQRDDRLVTITLREAEHWPTRNSDLDEWHIAAGEIEERGYDVVFVRDTRCADKDVPGFGCDAAAATDLHRRAELYASAFVNLGVSNGPLWMALAMDLPVVMLRPVDDSLGLTHGRAHFSGAGISPGGQMPGAPVWQRLVWRQDTAANIVAAFDEFASECRAPQTAPAAWA